MLATCRFQPLELVFVLQHECIDQRSTGFVHKLAVKLNFCEPAKADSAIKQVWQQVAVVVERANASLCCQLVILFEVDPFDQRPQVTGE